MDTANSVTTRLRIDNAIVELAPLSIRDRLTITDALEKYHRTQSREAGADANASMLIGLRRALKHLEFNNQNYFLEFENDAVTEGCLIELLVNSQPRFIHSLLMAVFELMHDMHAFEITDVDGSRIDGVEILPPSNQILN